MMGAAVFPPKIAVSVDDSYEYKHKPVRLGAKHGEFVSAGYPCGEFSYTAEALETAYFPENTDKEGRSRSTLEKYTPNTYFCPAMCNLKNAETHEQYSFDFFSESTFVAGPTLAPLFAQEWENRGQKCAYAHIAKGGVSIVHYYNREMLLEHNRRIEEHNKETGDNIPRIDVENSMWHGASAYFDQKVSAFFADAEERFSGDDMSNKILVWCQGESDRAQPKERYRIRLEILWEHMKKLGFTHFFCIRVGNWPESQKIHEVMQAQEEFCAENENCYIITRAMSFMPCKNVDSEDWFVETPSEEYHNCRDRDFGFNNPHINEKGFALIAKRMADNAVRVLRKGREPLLEKEIISKLIEAESK